MQPRAAKSLGACSTQRLVSGRPASLPLKGTVLERQVYQEVASRGCINLRLRQTHLRLPDDQAVAAPGLFKVHWVVCKAAVDSHSQSLHGWNPFGKPAQQLPVNTALLFCSMTATTDYALPIASECWQTRTKQARPGTWAGQRRR